MMIRKLDISPKLTVARVASGSYLYLPREQWRHTLRRRQEMMSRREQGGLIVLALICMVVLCLFGTMIIEIGLIESRCSQNDYRAQQAQQATDGGIEALSHLIFLELNHSDNLTAASLPNTLLCSHTTLYIPNGEATSAVTSGEIIKKAEYNGESGFCVYELPVYGEFLEAHKNLTVQISFRFSGGYPVEEGGGTIYIVPREYMDRGRVVGYKSIY